LTSLILIGSGCLVCLMPLAIYLLFLAYLNQRQRPTMLSGPWDYACVLLGLSGFILLGGPVLLSTLDSAWRSYWFRGNFAHVKAVWAANNVLWSSIAASYIALLVIGVSLFMFLRRRVTVIYNVDASLLEDVLVGVMDSLNLNWRRVAGGFEIGGRKRRDLTNDSAGGDRPEKLQIVRVPEGLAGLTAFVHLDTFPGLRHAVLRWYDYDRSLRHEIESQLARIFESTESPDNPAGGWFMTAAVALFFIMLLWMAFLIYQMVSPPKAT
jgi:hypothetical protein